MPPQRLLSQVHRSTAAWRVLAAALLLAALVQPEGTPALAAAPAQALVAAAPAAPQGCGPIIVTNTSDSGSGSLRAAVECALLAGQTITFASGLAGPDHQPDRRPHPHHPGAHHRRQRRPVQDKHNEYVSPFLLR